MRVCLHSPSTPLTLYRLPIPTGAWGYEQLTRCSRANIYLNTSVWISVVIPSVVYSFAAGLAAEYIVMTLRALIISATTRSVFTCMQVSSAWVGRPRAMAVDAAVRYIMSKLIHAATPDKTVAPACRPPPPRRRQLRLAAHTQRRCTPRKM